MATRRITRSVGTSLHGIFGGVFQVGGVLSPLPGRAVFEVGWFPTAASAVGGLPWAKGCCPYRGGGVGDGEYCGGEIRATFFRVVSWLCHWQAEFQLRLRTSRCGTALKSGEGVVRKGEV